MTREERKIVSIINSFAKVSKQYGELCEKAEFLTARINSQWMSKDGKPYAEILVRSDAFDKYAKLFGATDIIVEEDKTSVDGSTLVFRSFVYNGVTFISLTI